MKRKRDREALLVSCVLLGMAGGAAIGFWMWHTAFG